MNPNKISQDPHHLGLPSGVSKMIYEPVVHSTQTVHLSCFKASTVSKRTKSSFHLSLITLEHHWVRPKPFLSLWYVWRKSCTDTNTAPNGPKRDSTDPRHQGVPLSVSKMISKPVVRSAQTIHLSCTDTSTVSKRTKTRFHQVRPKQFLSLRYV
jgi:hypothetical protein